jgi:hypothetical protein
VNLTSRQGEGGAISSISRQYGQNSPKFFTTDFTDYADGNVFIRVIRVIRGSFFSCFAAFFCDFCAFSRQFNPNAFP